MCHASSYLAPTVSSQNCRSTGLMVHHASIGRDPEMLDQESSEDVLIMRYTEWYPAMIQLHVRVLPL